MVPKYQHCIFFLDQLLSLFCQQTTKKGKSVTKVFQSVTSFWSLNEQVLRFPELGFFGLHSLRFSSFRKGKNYLNCVITEAVDNLKLTMETKFKTGFQKEIFNYRYRIIADKIASPKNDQCVIISKPWCRFKFWKSLQIIVKASYRKSKYNWHKNHV